MARQRRRADRGSRGATAERERVFELVPHSERRRRQLLEVAGHIIETEGPDAVRMPRVAELAGCTRTLVYRYFPQREELLAAVSAHYYERLNAIQSAQEHASGIAGLCEPNPDEAWRAARGILESAWEVVEEIGMAGVILARSEFPRSLRSTRHGSEHARELELRWFLPLRAGGLSSVACVVALDCAISITYTLMNQYRAGEIQREHAIRMGFDVLHALVQRLRTLDDPS